MLYSEKINAHIDDFIERIEANSQLINEIDELAKKDNTLLHRFIHEPYADGYAVYQIIRVNKKSVRVRVCKDIGDDWVLPYWGKETTIPLDYAISSISRRDALDELFNSRKVL